MAIGKQSSYDGGLHMILALRDIRDTVAFERKARLAREASQGPRASYTSGQQARINKQPKRIH